MFLEKENVLSIWLHSKKSFGKYFHVFFCVLENALENTFSTNFSHFSHLPNKYYNKKSQYINPKKQKKKKKQKSQFRKPNTRS